jgi:flagellar motor switch protein FliN/FliY
MGGRARKAKPKRDSERVRVRHVGGWGSWRVSQVKAVNVEIQIVLGRATLPMAQLLRMGRGAVIPLDATINEEVWILANNHPIARGEIQINEDRISIAVTREANVYDFLAGTH